MFREEFKIEGDVFTITTNTDKTPEETKAIMEKVQAELNDSTNDSINDSINEAVTIDSIKKDLRTAGIKIKNIAPTNFGTEFIFFNKSDAISASDVIGTSKVKNNSVFVSL